MKPLAVGIAAYAVVRHHRARRARRASESGNASDLAPDPSDPVQRLGDATDLDVMPLDVDAQSQADADAAEDLAELELGLDDIEVIDETQSAAAGDRAAPRQDDGDLYGAHTAPAVDRVHPDDDRAYDDGQNWLEALETSAVENGAEPEASLDDLIDDSDILAPPHAALHRDTPVADHGAGGRRGL